MRKYTPKKSKRTKGGYWVKAGVLVEVNNGLLHVAHEPDQDVFVVRFLEPVNWRVDFPVMPPLDRNPTSEETAQTVVMTILTAFKRYLYAPEQLSKQALKWAEHEAPVDEAIKAILRAVEAPS